MIDPFVPDFVDVELGTERERVPRAFRALVDQRTLLTIEGTTIEFGLDEVLLDFRPNRLEQVPRVPDHRKVSPNRTLLLKHVGTAQEHDRSNHDHPVRSGRMEIARDGKAPDHHHSGRDEDRSGRHIPLRGSPKAEHRERAHDQEGEVCGRPFESEGGEAQEDDHVERNQDCVHEGIPRDAMNSRSGFYSSFTL